MEKFDSFGCETTIENTRSLDHWNACLDGFLSHSASTGAALVETLKLDPGFALGHACKGLWSLLLGRRELDETIHTALAASQACDEQNPVRDRERHYINALGAWINGSPTNAVHELEQVLKRAPHDALAMKMSHAIRFMLGDSRGMRSSLENISHVYRNHPAEGYFKGCYAFALEETGEYDLAERHGRKALDLAPNDAWGLHAVSHVFDMTGRPEEGLKWMSGKEQAWEHCNNFRYHVWWHIALMQLELGNFEKVLELYDDHIRKDKTDDYRDLSNATSVLLRLEFEGIGVDDRWEELAEFSAQRTQDNCIAFADVHYMMALCGTSDREEHANNLLQNMSTAAENRHHCEFTQVIKNPGVLIAAGLEAYRDQNFKRAFQCLMKARPKFHEIGGSKAQRDIFERLGIESAIAAGFFAEARALLKERDNDRGSKDPYSHNRWAALDNARTDVNTLQLGAA